MAAVEYSGSKILWVLWASPLCREHTRCPQAWSRKWWDDLACPESPCTPHLIALPGCSIPEIGCARHQRGHSGLMWLFPFLCSFPWLMRQPQLKLPWYNASGLLFFLTLHMEGSCQLAAEKIACSANESKSNRDLFQIVSIHFSGLLIAVILD